MQCLTCVSGYFLYNNQCYTSCPNLISYANTLTRTCNSCPTNCTQCTGDYTLVTCTKCVTGYVLDNGACSSNCITSGYVNLNGVCVGCSTMCGTCSITQTNCTSCDISSLNPYFYNNRCLSSCPSTFYNENSTFSCLKCLSPCETCLNSSIHSCQSCLSPFIYYNFDCLSNCPAGYYQSGYNCVQCVSPCQ